jgi:hypothetical protein
MIAKQITFFGHTLILACDANCSKAWGINSRPKVQLSDSEDDYAFLADGELAEAPVDPGTYEGECAKPQTESARLNKWCCRECERHVMVKPGEEFELPDFGQRRYNCPPHERAG